MADVGGPLNSRTTQVDSHVSGNHRFQRLEACSFRIVQMKAHALMVNGATCIWRPVQFPGPCKRREITFLAAPACGSVP